MILLQVTVLLTWFLTSSSKQIVGVDERWVCAVKQSCIECLRLTHCSWCGAENKCFSRSVPNFENYCKDNITESNDVGLSIEDTAICACGGEPLETRCRPPGVLEGAECSDRGQCVCGRCACDALPDPEHPTKAVMGEYCEFDNFSCDGPLCNEGPYSLDQPQNSDGEDLEEI